MTVESDDRGRAEADVLELVVVDDYEDSRQMLEILLQKEGFRVRSATNGRESVQLVREHHPDAIIMDLCMPELDGIEATRQLKADPATAAIPVIAYTAEPSSAQADLELFAAICLKPCSADRLLQAVHEVLTSADHTSKGSPGF